MITPQTYIEQIAATLAITSQQLCGSSRRHARYRAAAVYLLRETYGLSYPEIARLLGYADHTTAFYHDKQVRKDAVRVRYLSCLLPAKRYRRVTVWRPL